MSSYKYKILDLVFTTLFTFLVIFLTMCVIRDDERIFRNLHAYENGGSLANNPLPTTYFSLDWIVHPITRHYRADRVSQMYEMRIPVKKDACYSSGMTWSNGDCGPALWQQSDFCPGKNMKIPESTQLLALRYADVANPATASDILSQLYEKGGDGKRSMQRGDLTVPGAPVVSAYWWRNSNMADVCRIERIMEMNVFLNDDTTWSIAASHSTTILLWGAAVVMWVANIGDLMANNISFRESMSSLRKMKYILLVAPLAVLVFLRISAKTESTTGVDSARMLPNGSYFYVFFMTTLSSYIILSINPTVGDDEKDQEKKVSPEGELQPLNTEGGDEQGYGDDAVASEFKMNLSGFVKMKPSATNLNAYMPRTASENSTLSFSHYSASEVLYFENFDKKWEMSSDYFSTAQFYAFPLLTLGVYMTGTNYQVDSTLQQLFIASFMYGLIDVAVHRLKQMIHIVGRLSTEQAPSDNIVGRVIELVGLVLQGFIFVFIFMLMHWNLCMGTRLTLPVNGDKSLQAYIETYTSWSYLVFFTLSTLVKATTLMARNDASKDTSATATTAVYQSMNSIYNNRKSILFFLLNSFIGVLLALLTASLMSDKYTQGLPKPMNPIAQNNVLQLYRQYRSGWFEHA